MSLPYVHALLAQTNLRSHFEWGRLQSLDQWWHWAILLSGLMVFAWYIVWMYRKDSEELPRGTAVALTALRLAAVAGLLFYFFGLERRTDRAYVANSRVYVLVDTSQSMSLRDGIAGTSTATQGRMDAIVDEFSKGNLLAELRKKHDVIVCRFDQADEPTELATFAKIPGDEKQSGDASLMSERLAAIREARWLYGIAAAMLLVAIAFTAVWFVRSSSVRQIAGRPVQAAQSWELVVAIGLFIVAVVFGAVANLRHLELNPLEVAGLRPSATEQPKEETNTEPAAKPTDINWAERLIPRGNETRLGNVLRSIVEKERGGPIAGVVVLTDGGQNAGAECDIAVQLAQEAMLPLFPIGIGSDERPLNLKVVDLEAPQRVFPNDKFTLTGYVQAEGLPGTTVTVQLFSANEQGEGEVREDERTVDVGRAGGVVPVKFELQPEVAGIRTYTLKVKPVEREVELTDNQRSAKVEIVARKTKVLLFAGGPMREYIFLRNQLYRDRETTVHALLQSGRPGISQDADEVLFEFPKLADELFDYDCIVAFDPNWEELDELQVKLLERWVAEKAGGLIVVAGPVFTPQWSSRRRGDARIDTIKALYPVSFYYQGSAALSLGRFGSEQAWPLTFTREGLSSEFLWLDDDAASSERIWGDFAGVYGYYAVKDPKPGARVLARFSDPETMIDNELPIYFASQFYGSGRVFFQASGEMWRIRDVGDQYFEEFYTRLIRWASEGRLLRDSSRGVLLVDKDRCYVGDDVGIRAILQDAQFRPLTVENVDVVVHSPDGKSRPLKLRKEPDAAREGVYGDQITITSAGDWRIDLQHPSDPEQRLTREIRARLPALETERPQRNDLLLRDLAEKTGGTYYVGLASALPNHGGGQPPVVNLIKPQDQQTVVPGSPDKLFSRQLAAWLMAFLVGVLSLEWLIRRLSKLA